MRLPRDLTGDDLEKLLRSFGYKVTRQTGGHLRLTTNQKGEHHLTMQCKTLPVGTLAAILGAVADHFGMTRDEVAERLFGTR